MGVGPATASRAEQWSAVARVLQAGVEGPFPPLQLTMLWNLCVDMTSSGAPVLDRLESCAHLGRCRMIAHLFSRMKLILPDTPAPSRDRILFCYVEDQRLPLVTTTLCLLLWKFTLIDFYRVDIDNVTFKADDVWTATLTRLVHAAASKCAHIRSLRRRYHSRVRGTAAAALPRPIPTTRGPPLLVRRVRAALL